jgi:hypothetical protein
MEDEILTVGAALRTINEASYYALVSFTPELYEANYIISKTLLSKSRLNPNECQKILAAESESDRTAVNNKPVQLQKQNENQNMLHTGKVLPISSEAALMHLAEYWLHIKAINSKNRGARSDIPLILRNAVISNSPTVLALLKKVLIKRKRLAK